MNLAEAVWGIQRGGPQDWALPLWDALVDAFGRFRHHGREGIAERWKKTGRWEHPSLSPEHIAGG